MIKTYVILDIETTGLPKFGKYNLNPGVPKITELALVAVSSEHFLKSTPDSIPRVKHSLVKCFHPQRVINNVTERLTGLNNDSLENMRPFDGEACDLVIDFIKHLQQPVCLIAHNGNRHDFPLLQAHFKQFGKSFPEEVLCSDSLDAFQHLKVLEKPLLQYDIDLLDEDWIKDNLEGINEFLDNVEREHFIQLEMDLLAFYEEQLKEEDYADRNPQAVTHTEIIENGNRNISEEISQLSIESRNNLQERTPMKPIQCNLCAPVRKAPSHRNLSNINPGVRRQLFQTETGNTNLRPSYRLTNIYFHFFKKKITNAHSAEGDCLALLECLLFIGPSNFQNWVNENNVTFSGIQRYY